MVRTTTTREEMATKVEESSGKLDTAKIRGDEASYADKVEDAGTADKTGDASGADEAEDTGTADKAEGASTPDKAEDAGNAGKAEDTGNADKTEGARNVVEVTEMSLGCRDEDSGPEDAQISLL